MRRDEDSIIDDLDERRDVTVVDKRCDSRSARKPSIEDCVRRDGDLVAFVGECWGVGRSLGAKSVFSVYTGEAGSGKDEGRMRPTPRPTFPYASKREGDSADPRRCIAVDVAGAGSISENRTRLLLRDRQIDKVSPVLEMTESRSSL